MKCIVAQALRLVARALGCCAVMAFCLSVNARAGEPSYRDVLRRYVVHHKDTDGADRPPGYPAEANQLIALEYSVLLRKDGLDEPVDPERHQFQQGDQIRVRIQPLSDLYVYVFFEDGRSCRRCLLPSDKNSPRLAKHDQPVELPTDGGVFEFDAASQQERLVLIASERPDGGLSTLCEAVCKKRDDRLTPQERALQTDLRARNDKALLSIRNHQAMAVAYHGRLSAKALSRASGEMKQRGATELLLEESLVDKQTTTLVMLISKSASPPQLAVTIPLKSALPAAAGKQ